MTTMDLSGGLVAAEAGSFRDPAGQVYRLGDRVLRGIDERSAVNYRALRRAAFFNEFLERSLVIGTREAEPPDVLLESSFGTKSWSLFLEHDVVPFVTYPYEWTFSMLRDAALLQLALLERSLANGWTMKDATPYNIQWIGGKPVFIDVPSFEPWKEGEGWLGYRQFCAMFLVPLMMRAYLGLDHTRALRSSLEGVAVLEARKLFRGLSRFRRGVLSHILFPAMVERSIAKRERDGAPAKRRTGPRQSEAMVIGLVQSLARLVRGLKSEIAHTDWSQYDRTHSYDQADFQEKSDFVRACVSERQWGLVWDIGCNTGTFSRLCAPHAREVVSLDGDHDAVERLYLADRERGGTNILPLVMDIANMSPAQGWAGRERKAFDRRGAPDLLLCLALIHHIRMSSNIPNALFLDWIRAFSCKVIIEFVDRHDEMVAKLLTNKKEQYADYNRKDFETLVSERFSIKQSRELKGGRRVLYELVPS